MITVVPSRGAMTNWPIGVIIGKDGGSLRMIEISKREEFYHRNIVVASIPCVTPFGTCESRAFPDRVRHPVLPILVGERGAIEVAGAK